MYDSAILDAFELKLVCDITFIIYHCPACTHTGFRAMYESAILDAFELEAMAKARSLGEYTATRPTEVGVTQACNNMSTNVV